MNTRATLVGAAGLAGTVALAWSVRRLWRAIPSDAASPGRVLGIGDDVRLGWRTLDEVRTLADGKDAAPDAAIYDVSIRWGAFLAGTLQRVTNLRAQDRLSPAEDAAVGELVAALADAGPMVDRLGLPRPSVVTDASGSSR